MSGSTDTVAVSVAVKKSEHAEKVLIFPNIKEKSHFSSSEKCEILAETERFEKQKPLCLHLCGGRGYPGEDRHCAAQRRDRPDCGPGGSAAHGDRQDHRGN